MAMLSEKQYLDLYQSSSRMINRIIAIEIEGSQAWGTVAE